MPSVRVRRGSHYSTLLGDDAHVNAEQSTRPRSRTLQSIYRSPEDPEPQQGSPSSGRSPNEAGPSQTPMQRASNIHHHPGRVADHIMSRSHSSRALRGHSSRDYLQADDGRRDMSDSSRSGRVMLEGSQVDVSIPKDGRPGILESQLSLSSLASNPFRNASQNSLHHEDDIVEHLDVIGMV
jgi:hypothetical protein